MRTLDPSSDPTSEAQSDATNSSNDKRDTSKPHRRRSDTPSSTGTPTPIQDAHQTPPADLMRRESLTPRAQPSRPQLDTDAELADESGAETSDNSADNGQGEFGNDGSTGRKKGDRAHATSEELRLERLREAVLLSQQRARFSAAVTAHQAQQLPGSLAQRRVSPIKEESMSPTLDEAFASPMTGLQTTSTESTESARTVKGSVPPTPGAGALRTPSYPFPYVPGTPRQWSSGFHRPFTTLSPTVSAHNIRDVMTPRERAMSSGASTPVATGSLFMPSTAREEGEASQNEDYPSPNLYDLVLALNCEPGLDSWWTVVVNTVRDWYGAERATLAIPADASELETVPWGQKATYDQIGSMDISVPQFEERKTSVQQDRPLRNVQEPEKPAQKSSLAARPKLTARHSYAGFERDRNAPTTPLEAPSSARPERPRALSRTVSHAPITSSKIERPPWQLPSIEHRTHPLKQLISIGSTSDQEFSSVAATHQSGPYEAVFTALRALDVEANPLLDSAGVIRVLERGRLVTLTRDYALPSNSRGPSTEPSDSESNDPKKKVKTSIPDTGKLAARPPKAVRAPSDYFFRSKQEASYEEYEQFPASPWAQSPAPSPAIQADPEDNPFFASQGVDEDSFNPKNTPTDYAKAGQVAAIGVDRASTIIHIPLIHPVLSQVLPLLPEEKNDDNAFYTRRTSRANRSSDPSDPSTREERRAPIAVISFLAQTVPYPKNLVQSLKLLAPHLATTFANANQYTNALKQAANIRHRRLLSNPRAGLAIAPGEPESLEDLLRIDIDDINASVSGSITSPSDYSAHSRFSPGGSIQGTPGLDPGNNSGLNRTSVTHTPAHAAEFEAVGSYFDAKKRSSLSSKGSSGGNVSSPRPSQGIAAATSPDLRKRQGQTSTTEFTDTKGLKVGGPTDQAKAAAGESQKRRSSSPASHSMEWPQGPQKPALSKAPQAQSIDRRHHTQLHSFGADFKTSFSTLPATTTPSVAGPSEYLGHVRSNSLEAHDMLPPSEKLLRIIIDALPVQVFMATPSDGSITWANSKYLAYRGQDSRQIMQDPWHTIHADDLPDYMELWKRSLRTGVQLSHKVRLQRFDGQYRWFFVKIAPLKDKRQNIVHWVGTNMDFHEQHIAETNAARQQETAASEAKYRALANSSPQIVFAATKSKGVTFCNSQWTSYSGQTEELARGVGFMDHVHSEDLEKCRLPSFKDDGTPAEVPVSLHAYSRTSTSSTNKTSSSDESSDSQTVTSPGTDETAHQDDVHQLPQAKLSKLATTGILKVARDADGRPSYSTEVRLRNKEGKYRWHLVRVLRSELKDSDEEDQTWYGTCTDINDHKLLEQTLKETMDAKSRFLSNMSHEIRTPLNGITGMVNFLIDSNLTAEQMEHVNIIRNSAEGLRDLINDILDLSKVEAGMITLNMDWLHVRSLIEEVNDLTSALAIDKGLELNYIVEENVPPMVKGDRFRIRQVLLNVIGNAIKFTQRGEVFIRCQRLEAEAPQLGSNEALVQFEVIDTGNGFTEKEAEYLFKRFSQIDGSSTRQHGGTGLGLAISMQLVELHGGRMKASSVPNKGSTFTFSIKFGLPSDRDRPPQPAAALGVAAPPTPGPLTPAPQSPLITPSHAAQNLVRQIAARSKEGSVSPGNAASPGTDRRSSVSSGSSVPSLTNTSTRSERSSQSSDLPHLSHIPAQPPMQLQLPVSGRAESFNSTGQVSESSDDTDSTVRQSPKLSPLAAPSAQPPMVSIMVVCPLRWSREATLKHIDMTLPKTTPRNITPREDIQDALSMLKGDDAPTFTHVVLFLQEADQVVPFMDVLYKTDSTTTPAPDTPSRKPHSNTTLVIICDLSQRREIMQRAQRYDYEGLQRDRRLRFVFKPLKPSKLAVIFDPQKEREVSSDRMLEGAQAIAVSQKQVFDEMKRRLGSKGAKVLLVEDNRTNQMVLLKFLKRADVQAEAVMDGVQCTDKVFGNTYGTYAIILCDLHMPNKDGYQTCKEIRKWERKNRYPHLPIIALSANVLGDVYAKCVEAGFNGYVTKPVDFKVLSEVMMTFLDPAEPGKPHPFMKMRDEANFGRR